MAHRGTPWHTVTHPQVTFLVKWLALTVSDFGTLCLIFVPKIWMKHHDGSAVMADAKDKLRDVSHLQSNRAAAVYRASIARHSRVPRYNRYTPLQLGVPHVRVGARLTKLFHQAVVQG